MNEANEGLRVLSDLQELSEKKLRVQGSGLVWKIGKKNKKAEGGGGSRVGCLFP